MMKYIYIICSAFLFTAGCNSVGKNIDKEKAASKQIINPVDTISNDDGYTEGTSYKCDSMRTVEEKMLTKYQDKVKRKGKYLVIKLNNNNYVTFKDISIDPDMEEIYSFQNYIDEINSFIVHVQYYEGESFLVLNSNSGVEQYIDSYPILSPDKKRIATESLDLTAGYNNNAVAIYKAEKDSLVNEYWNESDTWGVSDLKWISNEEIINNKNTLVDYDYQKEKVLLKLVNNEWQ